MFKVVCIFAHSCPLVSRSTMLVVCNFYVNAYLIPWQGKITLWMVYVNNFFVKNTIQKLFGGFGVYVCPSPAFEYEVLTPNSLRERSFAIQRSGFRKMKSRTGLRGLLLSIELSRNHRRPQFKASWRKFF